MVVLVAVCDAHYKFTMVDVADSGRQSDGSIYNNCFTGYAIENNLLDLPNPARLMKHSTTEVPYVFLGDDADLST